MSRVVLSADLGQSNDFTAISITEEQSPGNFYIRYLERFPLGTNYEDQTHRICSLMDKTREKTKTPTLVLDRTGVGRAVVDLVLNQNERPIMITITGGNKVSRNGNEWSVPKRELIAPLILAFQNKKIQIAPSLKEADILIKELMNFKLKISSSGMDTYEAEKAGLHDDVVMSAAMGLFVLAGEKPQQTCVMVRQRIHSKYNDYDIHEARKRQLGGGVRYQL